ncbi:MAG: DUF3617 domain-containing protein [Leptospiraceae bacterium]|nr:DUF3617 domain-containing protein [Leptospiraceae bacterium]MDW7976917.1 DUF3617 family protein [Leptospiraceae bacterium]
MRRFHFSVFFLLMSLVVWSCGKKEKEEGKPQIQTSFKEGLWEFQVRAEVVGMQGMSQEVKFEDCLKKEDYVPNNPEFTKFCKITKQSFDGKTAEWEAECNFAGMRSQFSGKAVYSENSMEGEMVMQMDQQKVIQKMSGKYIGECKN